MSANDAEYAQSWLAGKIIVCVDHYVVFQAASVVELARRDGKETYVFLAPLDLVWKNQPETTKGLQRITRFDELADQSSYMIFDHTATAVAWCESMHEDVDIEDAS